MNTDAIPININHGVVQLKLNQAAFLPSGVSKDTMKLNQKDSMSSCPWFFT